MNIAHQITKVIQIVLMIGDKLASLKNNEHKKTTKIGGQYLENFRNYSIVNLIAFKKVSPQKAFKT
jgi:hypothetical protein